VQRQEDRHGWGSNHRILEKRTRDQHRNATKGKTVTQASFVFVRPNAHFDMPTPLHHRTTFYISFDFAPASWRLVIAICITMRSWIVVVFFRLFFVSRQAKGDASYVLHCWLLFFSCRFFFCCEVPFVNRPKQGRPAEGKKGRVHVVVMRAGGSVKLFSCTARIEKDN